MANIIDDVTGTLSSAGSNIGNAVVDSFQATGVGKFVSGTTGSSDDSDSSTGSSGTSYFLPGYGGEVKTSHGVFQSSPLLSTYSPRLFGSPQQLTHLNDMRLLSAEDGSDKPGAVGDFYLEKILQNAEIANFVVGRAVFTGGMNGILSGLRNLMHYYTALKKYGDFIFNNTTDNQMQKVGNSSIWAGQIESANLAAYQKALGDDDDPESNNLKAKLDDTTGLYLSDVGDEVTGMLENLKDKIVEGVGGTLEKIDVTIGEIGTALKTSFAVQQPFYTFDSDWFSYIQRVKMMINAFTVMLGVGNASVRIGDKMMKIGATGKYKEEEDVWANYRFITPNSNLGVVTAIDTQNGDTSQYVSFMIEPSGSSESYSNSVGESQIYSSVINSGSAVGNEIAFLTNSSQGAIDDAMINLASKSINAAESVLTSLTAGIGRFTAAVAGSMAKSYVGEHTIYPQIYQSSTSTTTKSITMHLVASSGDPYTYLTEICVPISFILGMVLPEMAKGSASAYAFPPIVQCNIPGLWGTRLGMITQVDITKNPSGKDFSVHGYPLSVDINITVADLQHVMVATAINKPAMFLNNNTMFDYIAQCAGVDKYRVNGSIRLITKLTLGIQACSASGIFTNIGNALHNDVNSYGNKLKGTYTI